MNGSHSIEGFKWVTLEAGPLRKVRVNQLWVRQGTIEPFCVTDDDGNRRYMAVEIFIDGPSDVFTNSALNGNGDYVRSAWIETRAEVRIKQTCLPPE